MKPDYLHTIRLNIFNEIANGRLRPFLPENSKINKIKHLVRDENTHTVLKSVDKKNVDRLLDEMDLTIYGYRSMEDISINIETNADGKIADVTIKPRKPYDLNDYIDIPPAPDQKSVYFLNLMADEFERIKIRSNKVLESTDSIEKLSLYANKHIQKSKQIAHDARIAFSKIQDKGAFITDNSDVYILFVLNLFLIRLIVYYRKFFKPFVVPVNESEEDLRLEFYRSLAPHKKYPYIFRGMPGADCNFPIAEDSEIPEYGKKCQPVFSGFDSASTPANRADGSGTFFEKKCLPDSQGIQQNEKFITNCQLNVLVDLFINLSSKKYLGGPPAISMNSLQLEDFLTRNFLDKQGNELNISSIRTLLKPTNYNKRPKESNPKRIDLSGFYGE